MTRNKKLVTIAAAGTLSVVMLASSAMAAMDNVTGYEKMKKALLSMDSTKNMTVDTNIKVSEDGKQFIDVTNTTKRDGDKGSLVDTVVFNGKSMESQRYTTEGKIVTKDAGVDEYVVYTFDSAKKHKQDVSQDFDRDSKKVKFVNLLIDTLTGDTKNYFTYDDKEVTLNLSANQVPELAQLGMTIVAEEYSNEFNKNETNRLAEVGLTAIAEKFAGNAAINNVTLRAKLDDNDVLESATLKASVSGTSSTGEESTFDIAVDLDIYDIGKTVAEQIDLTGKKVITKDRFHEDRD